MNTSHMVHHAVACLEGLDRPLSPRDLSRAQNVPLEECLHILRQFEAAGLVRENADGAYERLCAIEEITALEVLQALWQAPSRGAARVLYGNGFRADQVNRLAARAGAWPRG